MIHSSHSKKWVVSGVRETGHNGNLAKGEVIAVGDKFTLGKGLQTLDLSNINQNTKLQINAGEVTTPNKLRIKEVPLKSTGWFQIKDILEITAEVPSQAKLKLDWLEVGYDGISSDTALYIPEGKSAVLDFLVYGQVASMFFGREEYLISKEIYRPEGATMQEVIRRAVKELNEDGVPSTLGFDSLTETLSTYLEIGVIDSTNPPLAGISQFLYTVEIPDNGDSNDLAAVQAQYPDNNVQVVNRIDGITTYGILSDAAPADVVILNISNVYADCEECPDGYEPADLEGYCTKETETTYTWVEGEECTLTETAFNITLPDTECGESRLEELEAMYPNLEIVEGATIDGAIVPQAGGCKRTYTTKVLTNAVCPQCSEIYLQPFYGEAPFDFDGVSWVAEEVVYDETAKMGIYVKGKPFYMYPETYEEDFVPWIETSMKIKSMSFGASGSLVLNYNGEPYDPVLEFAPARRVSFSADVNNNAVALFGSEDVGNRHYTKKDIHKKNLFARTNLSQERILKYHKKYVQYLFKWKDNNLSQGGASRSDITHQVGFIVEYGRHRKLEDMLNTLGGAAGVEGVFIP